MLLEEKNVNYFCLELNFYKVGAQYVMDVCDIYLVCQWNMFGKFDVKDKH